MAERKKKFSAPKGNPYGSVEPVEQPTERGEDKPAKQEYYRFNLKIPIEYKVYLQEMAWKTRTRDKNVTITSYIADLIRADMEAHPDWADGLDELNK